MSQDITADILNQIMNIKMAGKKELVVKRYSTLLIKVLEIAKKHDYLDFSLDEKGKKLKIEIKDLNECRSIKPRFTVQVLDIEKYKRRFLPARNFGMLLISSSQGLITHEEAEEKKIGGCLIAYFY